MGLGFRDIFLNVTIYYYMIIDVAEKILYDITVGFQGKLSWGSGVWDFDVVACCCQPELLVKM